MFNLASINTNHETTLDASPSSHVKELFKIEDVNGILNLSINSFQKPKDARDDTDYYIMCKALSTVPFLIQNAAPNTDVDQYLREIAEVMEVRTFQKDSAIFHYNQLGDKLYMILKGSVGVFVPRSREQIDEERKRVFGLQQEDNSTKKPEFPRSRSRTVDAQPIEPRSLFSEKTSDANPHKQEAAMLPSKKSVFQKAYGTALVTNVLGSLIPISKRTQDYDLFSGFTSHRHLYFDKDGIAIMYRLRNLTAGGVFGELALFTSKRRTASAIAREDTILVSLSKENYRNIFEASIANMKIKAQFFQTLFDVHSNSLVNQFSYVFQERKFNFGQVLYRQGDIAKHVYLIRVGEVQVSRIDSDAANQATTQSKWINSSVDKLNRYKNASRATKKKIDVCIMSAGTMLGCIEVVEKKSHSATATALTDTIVYAAPVNEAKDLMIRHYEFGSKVKEFVKKQKAYESDRISAVNSVKKQLNLESQRLQKEKSSAEFRNNLRIEVLEKLHDLDSSLESKNRQEKDSSRQANMLLSDESPTNGTQTHRYKDSSIETQGYENFSPTVLQTEGTNRLSTEELEPQTSEQIESPKSKRILENVILTPNTQKQRRRVLRAISSKDFRNDPQLVLQDNLHKLTINELTQTKAIIYKNMKELRATQELSRTARDSTTIRKSVSTPSPIRINPRNSLTNRSQLGSMSPSRPYENKEILSTFRRQNLSVGAREATWQNKSQVLPEFSILSKKFIDDNLQHKRKSPVTFRGSMTDRVSENRSLWRTPRLRPDGVNPQELEIFGNPTMRYKAFYSIESGEDKNNKLSVEEVKPENRNELKQLERTSVSISARQESTRSVSQWIDPNELANLELGAPWTKKNASLRLNLQNLKPLYFIDVKPEDPMKTNASAVDNKTTRRQEPLQDAGSKLLYNLLLTTAPENKSELNMTERLQNAAMRACMISSKHNMFRRKPKRIHIAEANYNLANQFLSETARR